MLTTEQIHEAVACLHSMGYSVVKFAEVGRLGGTHLDAENGARFHGTWVRIDCDYSLPPTGREGDR